MFGFKVWFFAINVACVILTILQAHGKTTVNSWTADIIWAAGFFFGLFFFLFKS